MKTYKLNSRLLLAIIKGFKETGRWDGWTYESCMELFKEEDEAFLIMHLDGKFQLREVGTAEGYSEYDSTSIGGPLTEKELEMVNIVTEGLECSNKSLDLIDVLYSR